MSGRILIVDDVATNRIVLKVKLAEARYETMVASDAAECFRLVRDVAPDLILLDRLLPDMDGVEVLRRLRADPVTRDIAVIVTMTDDEDDGRLIALRTGADDVMIKPLDEQRLMARLRALLRARGGVEELRARNATLGAIGMAESAAVFDRPGLVALVTERPETAMHLRKTLAAHLDDRLVVQSRDEALAEASAGPVRMPDLYVIEADLGSEGGGLRLMSDLRSRGISRYAAVCILLAAGPETKAAMAFDLGANDVVADDADPRETAMRLRRLISRKCREDRLRAMVSNGLRLAVIDPLTGLYNRRYAMAQLGRIVDRARPGGVGLAVMVIDLDRFKAVNDAFGHAAGDSVLIEVARRLSAHLRACDLLARIGGEEFLVALPETSLSDARQMAERLCRVVEEVPIQFDPCRSLSVTVSIGVAAVAGENLCGPEVVPLAVEQADQALLTSKAHGRNQVTVCRPAA